jgi:hypothetical protein
VLIQTRKGRSQLIREARARREILVRLARTDINVFCELVMRDEKTGAPIEQASVHRAWHRLLDDSDRVLIWAHIESGKTQQVSVARTLFELGRDPSLRFLLLSNTKDQARKVATTIRSYIESSSELHDIFPDLRPGKQWGEYAFSVERATHAKDPSVQTSGVHGNILGSRLDRVVFDDILDYENSRTQDQRKTLIEWWDATITGRAVDECRMRGVGTAFHPQDILHHFARKPNWQAVRYPVVDPQTGEPRWVERWPLERIAKKAEELGPIEAARQLMCEARDDSASKFKREWIQKAIFAGEGTSLASALAVVPRGYRVYTGVDLGVQQHAAADETVLFTIAVDPYGVRSMLNIEAGRWAGPDIVGRIRNAHTRYQSIVVCENNAAQDYIIQFTKSSQGEAIPIIPYTTGRAKAHPEFGIESIGVEMSQDKWRIPNRGGHMHPEVQKWVDEMLFYDPAAHTGDRLMASFFAREGVKLGSRVVESHTSVDFNRR